MGPIVRQEELNRRNTRTKPEPQRLNRCQPMPGVLEGDGGERRPRGPCRDPQRVGIPLPHPHPLPPPTISSVLSIPPATFHTRAWVRAHTNTRAHAHTHSQQPDLGDLGSKRKVLKGSLARKSSCVPSDIQMTLAIRKISWDNHPNRTGPWPPRSLRAKNRPYSPSALLIPSSLGPAYLCKGSTACRTPGWGREPSHPAENTDNL